MAAADRSRGPSRGLRALIAAGAALVLAACSGQSQADGGGAAFDEAARSYGDPDAPVQVIEYVSATCVHCANFHVNVLPDIKSQYIDTGQLYLTVREFPLDNTAAIGFLLARCAPDDRYLAVLDSQFQAVWRLVDQQRRGTSEFETYFDFYQSFARTIGLDEAAYRACLSDEDAIAALSASVDQAEREHQVRATPTFVVDGEVRQLSVLTVEGFAEMAGLEPPAS